MGFYNQQILVKAGFFLIVLTCRFGLGKNILLKHVRVASIENETVVELIASVSTPVVVHSADTALETSILIDLALCGSVPDQYLHIYGFEGRDNIMSMKNEVTAKLSKIRLYFGT